MSKWEITIKVDGGVMNPSLTLTGRLRADSRDKAIKKARRYLADRTNVEAKRIK